MVILGLMTELGPALKAAREAVRPKLTQTALAAKMGVAQSAVSKWETGETTPDARQLIRFAAIVRRTLDDLVVGVDRDYDRWRRDLVRQSGTENESSYGINPRGGPDDGSPAARVLKEVTDHYHTLVVRVTEVADQLREIARQQPELVEAGPAATRGARRGSRAKTAR